MSDNITVSNAEIRQARLTAIKEALRQISEAFQETDLVHNKQGTITKSVQVELPGNLGSYFQELTFTFGEAVLMVIPDASPLPVQLQPLLDLYEQDPTADLGTLTPSKDIFVPNPLNIQMRNPIATGGWPSVYTIGTVTIALKQGS